jgi:hypothetical protein
MLMPPNHIPPPHGRQGWSGGVSPTTAYDLQLLKAKLIEN